MSGPRVVDRTPKPCLHKVARHTHGTHACYALDTCRCPPCAQSNTTYEADRTRQHAYGRWDHYVDATPARTHVRELQAAGLGWKRIAYMSGVSNGSMWKLIYGKTRPDGTRTPSVRITKATAEHLLAVPTPSIADLGAAVVVDGTGTRRRVEALIALGWSVRRLCNDNGLGRQTLDSALAWVPVCVSTVRAVTAMYDAIGDTPAPETSRSERQAATRSRNRARAAGWMPPGEWDSEDLDDPYAAPPAPGDAPRGIDLDEWAHLVSGGVDPEEAAQRCATTVRGVREAATAHADRSALWLLAVHTSATASTERGADVARRLLSKARAA